MNCALTRLASSVSIGTFGGYGVSAKTPEAARSRVSGAKNGALYASSGIAVSGRGTMMAIDLAD